MKVGWAKTVRNNREWRKERSQLQGRQLPINSSTRNNSVDRSYVALQNLVQIGYLYQFDKTVDPTVCLVLLVSNVGMWGGRLITINLL